METSSGTFAGLLLVYRNAPYFHRRGFLVSRLAGFRTWPLGLGRFVPFEAPVPALCYRLFLRLASYWLGPLRFFLM